MVNLLKALSHPVVRVNHRRIASLATVKVRRAHQSLALVPSSEAVVIDLLTRIVDESVVRREEGFYFSFFVI